MRIKVILERDRSPADGEILEVHAGDTSGTNPYRGVVSPTPEQLEAIGLAGLAD